MIDLRGIYMDSSLKLGKTEMDFVFCFLEPMLFSQKSLLILSSFITVYAKLSTTLSALPSVSYN